MDLRLDPAVAAGYTNQSQIARRVTEHWAAANLFCPACPSDHLEQFSDNRPVEDYFCPQCELKYQLKSQSKPFGRVVANSAYAKKLDAIETGNVPNYAFLHYATTVWRVENLFVVPAHLISASVVEQRRPLQPTARRAGWIGSNIRLDRLPEDGRVLVVANGSPIAPQLVRDRWHRYAFLGIAQEASGGWGADVLTCIIELQRQTGTNTFSLQDFYSRYESALQQLHPNNRHVRDKMRQQLQVLRDGGVLEFMGRGRYKIVPPP